MSASDLHVAAAVVAAVAKAAWKTATLELTMTRIPNPAMMAVVMTLTEEDNRHHRRVTLPQQTPTHRCHAKTRPTATLALVAVHTIIILLLLVVLTITAGRLMKVVVEAAAVVTAMTMELHPPLPLDHRPHHRLCQVQLQWRHQYQLLRMAGRVRSIMVITRAQRQVQVQDLPVKMTMMAMTMTTTTELEAVIISEMVEKTHCRRKRKFMKRQGQM